MTAVINPLLMAGWVVHKISDDGAKVEFVASPPPTKPLCRTDGCPAAGTSDQMKRRDAKPRRIIDTPMYGKPVTIIVRVGRFRCRACGKQATQPVSDIHEQRRMTNRCVEYIERESLRRPFTWVARDLGIDDTRIRLITRKHFGSRGILNPQKPSGIRAVGIDDIYLEGVARTMVLNLETRRPIEILECQTKDEVAGFFAAITRDNPIELVCMDMAGQFASAVKQSLPNALIVYDKWHVIRTALDAVNDARIQCQKYIRAEAGLDKRKNVSADIQIKDLKKHYTLFLRRRFHQFGPGLQQKLENYLDQWPSLGAAYALKEQFCDIWAARSRKEAEERITAWLAAHDDECERYKREMRAAMTAHKVANKRKAFVYVEPDPGASFRSARTAIETNRDFVLNYFEPANVGANGRRYTNAATEAVNGIVKGINRLGRGYKFTNLRARVLLREPYVQLPRKAQRVRRQKQSSPTLNPFKLPTGPLHRNQVIKDGDFRYTVCVSVGCEDTVYLPKRMTRAGPDHYDVPHVFRFCQSCYDARLAYAQADDGLEGVRYAQQQKMRLKRPV